MVHGMWDIVYTIQTWLSFSTCLGYFVAGLRPTLARSASFTTRSQVGCHLPKKIIFYQSIFTNTIRKIPYARTALTWWVPMG